jgi:two-component system cell cycle response regulator DivK
LAVADWAKVLIVEDDEDVRLMLSTYLASKGCEVASAGTAVEGVSTALRIRPDLILMDLGLPDANGLSAARAIRSNVGYIGTPVLVVTAYDTMQFRNDAMEVGCAGYMVKPVEPEQLLETVRLLVGADRVKQGTLEGVRDEGSVGGGLRRYPPANADVP